LILTLNPTRIIIFYAEAKEKNFFVKDKSGSILDGWCWPGKERKKETYF
jgi:alpha-glucosidase (family GH31 glycosyl hydrolase)